MDQFSQFIKCQEIFFRDTTISLHTKQIKEVFDKHEIINSIKKLKKDVSFKGNIFQLSNLPGTSGITFLPKHCIGLSELIENQVISV